MNKSLEDERPSPTGTAMDSNGVNCEYRIDRIEDKSDHFTVNFAVDQVGRDKKVNPHSIGLNAPPRKPEVEQMEYAHLICKEYIAASVIA